MPTNTFFHLPEEKQQRLLDAAQIEFSRHSLQEASIANIVKLAGIPRGSFYQYFENKADLPDRPNLTRPVAPTKPEQGNLTDDEYKVLMDKYEKDYDRYKKEVEAYNLERQTYAAGLTTYANYLQQKFNTENGLVTLEDSKKALKKGLIDSYAQLLALEDTIQITKKQLDLSEKQLKNTKLRYDLGLITLTDYKKQVVSNQDAKNSYDTLIVNYNSLKNGIEKPWILNTGK